MEISSANGTTDSNQTQKSLTHTEIFHIMDWVIFILGITANGLVIYVTGFKMKTTVNSVWFLNLALADFIYILSLVFHIIHWSINEKWPFGGFLCKFLPLLQIMNMFASIFLLTVISLDRCFSVWKPVWAQNKRTPHKARLICVYVWLTSLACSIPFGLYRTVINDKCVNDTSTSKTLASLHFVIGFLIPFLIITCCYVAIGFRANQVKKEKKMRPFLIILIVILSFFIFWLPIHIINLTIGDQTFIFNTGSKLFSSDVVKKISEVSYLLCFLYSCLNPFLYIFMCNDIKQKLKHSVFLVLEHAFKE